MDEWGVVEHLGEVIRSMRESAGISLGALATSTNYSQSHLCNIEAGRRPLTIGFVEDCDRALGTTPLLAMLWRFGSGPGDDVKRRAFFNAAGLVAGTIGLKGSSALAEVVRSGLLDTTGGHEDWDAVIKEFEQGLVVAPTQRYGESLLAQLLLAQQQIAERGKSKERLRAAAHLVQLYGLWLGNQGNTPTAHGWYRTATTLAQQSGDALTQAYVQGRSLSRGVYEGSSARDTLVGVHQVLSLKTGPCEGFMESYSALVHVHALTGNLSGGRAAVRDMHHVADALPNTGAAIGPVARTAHFSSYLECRCGTLSDAEKAYAAAAPLLRAAPVWNADARIYYARAQVAAGGTAEGIAMALDAIKHLDAQVHVLNIGVQDLLSIIPRQYRSDELEELKTYSATGPAPWETV